MSVDRIGNIRIILHYIALNQGIVRPGTYISISLMIIEGQYNFAKL